MSWIKRTYYRALNVAQNGKKQQQFLWLVTAVLILIVGIIYFKRNYVHLELLGVAGISLAFSFLYGCIVKYPLLVWTIFGFVLSEITSTILLAIVFYLIIFPVGLIARKKRPSDWTKIEAQNNFKELF